MGTYASAAKTANALLGRKGATVVFTRTTAGTFDPVTETATGGVSKTFSMKGVGLPPGRSAENRVGSLERRNIIELHLAPMEGTVPDPGDKVRWAGNDWTVIWAAETNPAGDGAPYALVYAER